MILLIEWLCLMAFFRFGEYGFSIVGVSVILRNGCDHFVLLYLYRDVVVGKTRW